LNVALLMANTATLKVLLEAGANPNQIDGDGSGALHVALGGYSLDGWQDQIKLLLDKKADVNLTNNYGITPIMSLFESAAPPLEIQVAFNLLLAKGANITAVDGEGNSLLMYAVRAFALSTPDDLISVKKIIKTIIQKGVAPNRKNKNGQTAIDWFDDLATDGKVKRELRSLLGAIR
jgi:uncharacterized protein